MDFRLLGSFEVYDDAGHPVVLRSLRQRSLLALLLCRAGETVPTDQLIDEMWTHDPPTSALKNLHVYVHRLRRSLGADDRIIYRPPGYAVVAGADEIDIHRFAATVRDGNEALAAAQVARASELFGSALTHWRGPALADLRSVPVLDAYASSLTEQRLDALEARIDADLALGRHRELLAELPDLAAENPLRERLHAALMLALYRAGRRSTALESYQAARRALVDELGLDPGPHLQQLHQAILGGEPVENLPDTTTLTSADPADPVDPRERGSSPYPAGPCLLPTDVADFTGRVEEADTVHDFLVRTDGSAVRMCAIVGRGGVGKTTLAIRVAHRLREEFPDGQLYVNLQGTLGYPADPTEVLGWFLRALGVDSSVIPEAPEERAAMYRARLGDRRVLVVLDDAADEAQVLPLLPGHADCGVLVTGRNRLAGLPGARPVELDALPPRSAVELLTTIVGPARVRAEPGAAHDVVRLCGHLPLAVRVGGARLASRQHWSLSRLADRLADERHRLDELVHGHLDVRASLQLGYDGLTEREQQLLRLLGLLDAPDVAGWVAAALLDIPLADAEELLDRLVDGQLVAVAGQDATGETRYRLHDLIRLYARERAGADEPTEVRDAALARVFGCWLALTARAHEGLWGGAFAVLHGDGPRWQPDPGFADRLVGPDPLAWYEAEQLAIGAAVRQAGAVGLDELCWDIAVSAVSLFELRSHYDVWQRSHEDALAAAHAAGNARGEAVVRTALGLLYANQHRHEQASAVLGPGLELLELLGDKHALALALPLGAYADYLRGDYTTSLVRYGHALPVLRELGDRGSEVLVLRCIGQLHLDTGRPDLAGPYLYEALDILDGDAGLGEQPRPQVLYRLAELHLAEDRPEEAERTLSELLELSERLQDLQSRAYALRGLGDVRLRRGSHTHARELLDEALSVARAVGDALLQADILLALGGLQLDGDDHRTAATNAADALAVAEELRAPLWQACAHHLLGRAHRAAGEIAAAESAERRVRELRTTLR